MFPAFRCGFPLKREKVESLSQHALELDFSSRSAFLREECSDAEVPAEVERLLIEHNKAGGFLSAPELDDFSLGDSTQRILKGELLWGRFASSASLPVSVWTRHLAKNINRDWERGESLTPRGSEKP